MLAVGFFRRVLLRQFQQRNEIRIINADDRPVIADGRIHHHVRQPLGRGNDLRLLVPGFPRLGVERLLLADFQERIARDGIERHDAAIRRDRQLAEFGEREILVRRRLQFAEKPQRHHERQNNRNPLFHLAFLVLLLETKPTR